MRKWPRELHESRDAFSGARVTTLTDYLGHSNHLYFTNNGLWDEGARLLFASDRENHRDLFSVELATGEITQITETGRTDGGRFVPQSPLEIQKGVVSPRRRRAYLPAGPGIVAVDLENGAIEAMHDEGEGFRPGILSMAADENAVVTVFCEDTLGEPDPRFVSGYNGFLRYFESNPRCRIVSVRLDDGRATTLHEDRRWLAHVNCSPTAPDALSFCHEGPWQHVEQRIWGMELSTGRRWAIRPQETGEYLGHEYWLGDGKRIGYHGHALGSGERGAVPVFGTVSFDSEEIAETPFPHDSNHYHSRDEELIIGDGPAGKGLDYLFVWKKENSGYVGPRVLAHHGSSRHFQALHVHPRVSPDGRWVVYTSDRSGYGQVCIVELPPFEELPAAVAHS